MLLPDNLKRIRIERHLSQTELAARSGISQQRISALENGLRLRDPADLLALARALDVPIKVLTTRWRRPKWAETNTAPEACDLSGIASDCPGR